MKRRGFIAGSALATLASAARAQGKVYKVGLLASDTEVAGSVEAFRQAMAKAGYVEGKNLTLVVRWPKTAFDQDPDIAPALVRQGVDAIVAWGAPAALAAQRATPTIPIVFMGIGDPVGIGLVQNLSMSGTNVTGITDQDDKAAGKALEIFYQAVPRQMIGVAYNPGSSSASAQVASIQAVSQQLGFNLQMTEASNALEYDIAFSRFLANSVQSVFFASDDSTVLLRTKIAEWALAHRLPSMFQRIVNVQAGGLMGYGADLIDQFRQAAVLVDKIFKGASPAGMPVSKPEKFELAINGRTARALGITIPSSIMGRASTVLD